MSDLTRMILELPTDLIQASQKAIASGQAQDINELIISALQQKLLTIAEETSTKNLENDSIWELGTNPVVCDIKDVSENLDSYLYDS
jgi:hypothetical protein